MRSGRIYSGATEALGFLVQEGSYWSSLSSSDPTIAQRLLVGTKGINLSIGGSRYGGYSLRCLAS